MKVDVTEASRAFQEVQAVIDKQLRDWAILLLTRQIIVRRHARDGVLIHVLKGHMTAVLIDDDPRSSNNQALNIRIELASTPAKVSVRDIWIKRLL